MFAVAMTFFSCNALEFVSVNNQECKIRPQVVNINSNNPFFYPYNTEVNKCSGGCNNVNDRYLELYLTKCQELMKQDTQNDMKLVSAHLDYMQVFVIINNVGPKINVDVNVKN